MFSPSSPDILKPKKASQQIISKIRSAILTQSLAEGDRLPPEPELMRHFGVSRQTMREALCALESMGLLTIRQGIHGGAYIRTVDMKTAQDGLSNFLHGRDFSIKHITEVRLSMEPRAAAIAATVMDESARRDLRELLEKCRKAIENQEDIAKLRRMEISFHELIVSATENPILMLMHRFAERLLWNVKTKMETKSDFSLAVFAAHEKILAAIESGDAKAASARMEEDLIQVERNLLRIESELAGICLLEPDNAPAPEPDRARALPNAAFSLK